MGTPEALALLPLAESIADGTPIDWDAAEAGASGRDLAMIRQLRVLSDLAGLHRSMPAAAHDTTGPAPDRHALAAPAIGSWAQLTLIERLGGGTFGDVYRAWDRHLEREVALKLLRADESVDDLQASGIAREGRLLARVRHVNVITVHGVDVHDGRVGLWMELVRGVTLEQRLREAGPLSAREAALVGIDLCRALAAIHAAGLIHRDVKAQNVMREDGGRIVLMDLGTGREADAAGRPSAPDLAGTPLYLAPEIFSGAPASERTDLYSLGVLLYHLVTGSFPVRATTIQDLHDGHKQGRRQRLRDVRADLPTAFVGVVERAIHRNPKRRYATAGAFESDLARALETAAVDAIDGVTPAIVDPVGHANRGRTSWFNASRIGWLAALAAIVAAIAIVPLYWPMCCRPLPGNAVGPIRSIAVLPLANLSGDPAQEYFADGMTDELIATLGRLGDVNVTSRTSSMQFKRTTKSLPDIARALHVDAVLEGSIQIVPTSVANESPSGGRVRINARLIVAGTDTQVWNRTFERVLSDVMALQGEVATAVANGINLRLTSQQQGALARVGKENAAAREAYLQGNYLLWNNVSRDTFVRAREFLERAVRIDPDYAPAYASLARCYTQLDISGVLSRAEAARLATTAAMTAVRLDPSLPEAQNQLATIAFLYQWDWNAAERGYRRAIELNPSYTGARLEYARFLMADGRLDAALEQARLAEEQDPLSAEPRAVVGIAYYYERHFDLAVKQRLEAIRIAPNSAQQYLGLGRAYAGTGDFDRAIVALREAVAKSPNTPYIAAELARTYAVAGRAREARDLLASLTAARGGPPLSAQYRSYVYAALGEQDRAFEWLAKAVDEREPNVLWARVDPRFDSMRKDPRFDAILKRLVPSR